MKVRVTYTVDYEETPAVIETLVTKCREDLKGASRFKFNTLNLEDTASDISATQEKLALVSEQLSDCYNMAMGYIAVQKELLEKSPEPATETVNEDN